MPTKVSLFISIFVSLAIAVFAYITKGEVEKKNDSLRTMTQKFHTTDTELTGTKKTLKKTSEDLAAANKSIEDQKGQIETLNTTLTTTKAEIESNKTAMADLNKSIADLKAELEGYKNPTVNTPEPPIVAELKEKLAKETAAVAELTQVQNTLKEREKTLEESVAKEKKRVQHYEQPIYQAGLTGRVVAVNAGWNFVVIDLGDKQGVTVNAPLFVMRGGQAIARLKVTSVEPRSSIADVVGGSMPKGMSIQAGDRVVFAGVRGQQAPPPQDAVAPPTTVAPPAGSAPQANAR